MSPILQRATVRHEAKIEIADLRAILELPDSATLVFRDDAVFVAWESTGIEAPSVPVPPRTKGKPTAPTVEPPKPAPIAPPPAQTTQAPAGDDLP